MVGILVYKKLVRDNVPEIIKNNGEEPIFHILSNNEYKLELEIKGRIRWSLHGRWYF